MFFAQPEWEAACTAGIRCGARQTTCCLTYNAVERIIIPPFTPSYWQCLTSSLKVEALGVNEGALHLLEEAGEQRACLALRWGTGRENEKRERICDSSGAFVCVS